MKRHYGPLALMLACCAAQVGYGDNPMRPNEQAGVAVVEVPVTATGKDGQAVVDLKPEEFVVKDEGEKKPLLFAVRVSGPEKVAGRGDTSSAAGSEPASTPAPPRNFVFLFDLTFNDSASLRLARKTALEFVAKQAGSDAYFAVFTLDSASGVKLLMNFTRDKAQTQDAIVTLGAGKASASLPDSAGLVRVTSAQQLQQQGAPMPAAQGDVVLDPTTGGVNEQVTRNLQEATLLQYRGQIGGYLTGFRTFANGVDILPGRKIVIFFSKGFDAKALTGQTTQQASEQAEAFVGGQFEKLNPTVRETDTQNIDLMEQVVSALASSDCRLFCIDSSGATARIAEEAGSSGASTRSHTMLEQLAAETGGAVFRSTNDLTGAMSSIDAATATYYLLAYNAPASGKGKYHKIDVDVTRPGVKLMHRKGYYEGKPFQQYSDLERQVQIASFVAGGRASGALEVTSAAIPFPPCTAASGTRAPIGRCALVVEIPSETLAKIGASGAKDFDVYSFAISSQGGEIRGYLHGVARIKDPKKAAGLRYSDVMDLVPGQFQLRTIVRNLQTGDAVTSTTAVSIEPAGGFRSAAVFVSEKGAWENTTSKDVAGACHPFAFKGNVVPALATPSAPAGSDLLLLLKNYNLQIDATGKPDLDVAWFVVTPAGLSLALPSFKFLQGDWPNKSEYDLMFKLTLPAQLRPGPHRLAVRTTDRLTRATQMTTLPFVVP